jgi:hypothetical protein
MYVRRPGRVTVILVFGQYQIALALEAGAATWIKELHAMREIVTPESGLTSPQAFICSSASS